MSLLTLRNVKKGFDSPDGSRLEVLDVPAFSLGRGEQVALAGSSGCGKTTLLHVIAGILRPDSGEILFEMKDGAVVDTSALPESRRDAFRAAHIGYVFQTFHLLQGYTALENVLLGMAFGPGADRGVAESLLAELGLADRMDHRPRQLSVGQQQRVAVARALAGRPDLVLADEPTGNLDHRHAKEALDLMRRLCASRGAALLLVSHDPGVLGSFERVEDLATINRAARPASATTASGAPR